MPENEIEARQRTLKPLESQPLNRTVLDLGRPVLKK